MVPRNLRRLASPVSLLAIGVVVGFAPVALFHLPRSSESWSHLQNLEIMPSALEAANVPKMIDLLRGRPHYAKYPLFYVVCKTLAIDTPGEAALFSAAVFSTLPLLVFVLAKTQVDDLEAFFAGTLVGITPAFVYTMNFFSGGEPLAIALLLLGTAVYLRQGPLFSLPAFLAIILLHPFTSIFLWLMLLLLPFFARPQKGFPAGTAVCTSTYAFLFLAWILYQISEGLPLGGYITASLNPVHVSILVLIPTSLALLALTARGRKEWLKTLLSGVTRAVRENLVPALLFLEILLLIAFMVSDIPGTEQILSPATVAFYVPLLGAIALTYFGRRKVAPLGAVLALCFLLLTTISLLAFPRGIPVYRLAPYGALALALLLSPVIRSPALRPALLLLVATLAFTAYPPPRYYFGFDEQYYPWEEDAIITLSSQGGGRILADVRMEDLLSFRGFENLLIPDQGPVDLAGRDLAFVTYQMRQYGFYPPGAEWYRNPFKLDMAPLDGNATRLYDSRRIQIYHLSGSRIKLAEAGA